MNLYRNLNTYFTHSQKQIILFGSLKFSLFGSIFEDYFYFVKIIFFVILFLKIIFQNYS